MLEQTDNKNLILPLTVLHLSTQKLSQFWYDDKTALTLAQEVLDGDNKRYYKFFTNMSVPCNAKVILCVKKILMDKKICMYTQSYTTNFLNKTANFSRFTQTSVLQYQYIYYITYSLVC